MENSVKHFVRKILGIHFLLLALLLAVVTGGAKHVYNSARAHALVEAEMRQKLLASQTAHGVSGFYASILSDLSLLKPDEDDGSDLPDLPQLPADIHPFQNMGIARQAVSTLLVHQLDGRAHLFLVDEQMRPHSLGSDDRPFKAMTAGSRNLKVAPLPPTTNPSTILEHEVIDRFGPWLKDLKEPAISDLELIDDRGIKIVSVPLMTSQRTGLGKYATTTTRRAGWLIAAVSARPIEHNFLSDMENVSEAFVIDESRVVMAAAHHDLLGTRVDENPSSPLGKVIAQMDPANATVTATLDHTFRIGSKEFEPSVISTCPVKVMGKHWFVLIVSPLNRVDAVVKELAWRAVIWAGFVAISMTGILVSTAAQLILSRMRMERVRHGMLQNEMRQARQIQLAWLPQKTRAICGNSRVEIATLNRPATHISGDFYNFFELPDGRTAVVIGDVTGHGTAAAFLMATTQLLVRNTLPHTCDPGRCLEEVNHQLTNQVFNGQFVTMQILVIDPRTGEVDIATAGHPAPLVSEGESFQSLKIEPQLVAGVDPMGKYPTERFRLRSGASILLYTDGVVETVDPAGNLLRLSGLLDALVGRIETSEALLHKAVSAVNTFRRGQDLLDDLTMVAVHLLPEPHVQIHSHAPAISRSSDALVPTA